MSALLNSWKISGSYIVGGEFNIAPPAPIDGQFLPLQLDSAGNLLVNVAAGTITATNPSVGSTGSTAPTSATEIGVVDSSGKLQNVSGLVLTNARAATVAIVDGIGNQITSFGGGTQYASGTAVATPTGTQILGWDGTDVWALSAAHLTNANALTVQIVDINGNQLNTQTWALRPGGSFTSALAVNAALFGTVAASTASMLTVNSTVLTGPLKTALDTNFLSVKGQLIATAAAGVIQVGVVGNAGAVFDFVDNTASGASPTGLLVAGWDSANLRVRALKVDTNQNLEVGTSAVVDANNTTSTPLGSNGVFTGTSTNLLAYNEIVVNVFADQAGTLQYQFSSNGVNWDNIQSQSIVGGIFEHLTLERRAEFFRLVYTNGGIAQTNFRLQTLLTPLSHGATAKSFSEAVDDNDTGILTKSQIVGHSTAGSNYIAVKVNSSGALEVDASGVNVPIIGTTVDGITAETPFLVVGGESNDATAQYQPIPLGTTGRSVIIEGFSGGTVVPVSLVSTTVTNTVGENLLQLNSVALGSPSIYGTTPGLVNVLGANVSTPGIQSAGNSSTSVLGSNGVFTGTFEDVSNYAAVSVSIFADQASAVNGVSFQWSPDGVNADVTSISSLSASSGRGFSLSHRGRYFRVVYTNGATAQGAFRLQTSHHVGGSGVISKPYSQAVTNDNYATLVLAGVAGQDGTNINLVASKGASTAAVAADESLVVALSPNSPVPTGANTIGKVDILGNAGATLDSTVGAATAPTNALATSVVYQTTVPSLTAGQAVAAQCDVTGSRYVNIAGRIPTYSAVNVAPATGTTASTFTAVAGDIAVLPGSATKTIRVTRVEVTLSTSGTAAIGTVQLVKRSTADSAGTSSTMAVVPHDSRFGAATAVPLLYTAAPTVGTAVGTIRCVQFNDQSSTVPGAATWVWTFGDGRGGATGLVLNGIAQELCVNLPVAVATQLAAVSFEWTEDNS